MINILHNKLSILWSGDKGHVVFIQMWRFFKGMQKVKVRFIILSLLSQATAATATTPSPATTTAEAPATTAKTPTAAPAPAAQACPAETQTSAAKAQEKDSFTKISVIFCYFLVFFNI